MADNLMRRWEVEQTVSISKSELYRLVAAGKFPRPVQFSAHVVRWRESDVQQWLRERGSPNGSAPDMPPQRFADRERSRMREVALKEVSESYARFGKAITDLIKAMG